MRAEFDTTGHGASVSVDFASEDANRLKKYEVVVAAFGTSDAVTARMFGEDVLKLVGAALKQLDMDGEDVVGLLVNELDERFALQFGEALITEVKDRRMLRAGVA